MTRIDDVRKTIETTLGTLTPAKAQELAKGLLEPDARKDAVAKTAGDLLEWSQKNRQRIRDLVRREIRDQLEQVGVASRADLDALKKRVRELERQAGMTASGRRAGAAGATGGAAAGAKRGRGTAGGKGSANAQTPGAAATRAKTASGKAPLPKAAEPKAAEAEAASPKSQGAKAAGAKPASKRPSTAPETPADGTDQA